ncbi:MAG: VOC family protein [Oscillospiraceae bacterium]
MIRKLDHMVITTARLPACLAFYEALGFRAQEAGGRWELFSGDFKINVHSKGQELEPKAQTVQTGSADVCFEIDGDLALCRAKLMECGIHIELGMVTRHGVRGEMHSLYLRDPDGNLIELCSYADCPSRAN